MTTSLELRRRARALGIQPSYLDATRGRVHANPGALEALIELLGPGRPAENRLLEPVIVLRTPRHLIELARREPLPSRGCLTITDEHGDSQKLHLSGILVSLARGGVALELRQAELTAGYYDLYLEIGPRRERSFLIVAPARLEPSDLGVGVFQPVYGLREGGDLGIGSFGALERLGSYLALAGCSFVGTLPCYAQFSDGRFDASPYLPISRLAWNETFIDVAAVPELSAHPELEPEKETLALADEHTVDYRAAARRKRDVLERLGATLYAEGGPRRRELERFLIDQPIVGEYAAFRARLEPARIAALDPERYHSYVQFLADSQLRRCSSLRSRGLGLYLDFPLGVHPDGFDVANWPNCFVAGASVGAPPDAFFSGGQRWGFPPLSPSGLRASHFAYLIEAYRQVFVHASMLRLDHVMGLERQWVVPDGFDAVDGAYLDFPNRELRAVALVEAARAGASIVGEDLGTVSEQTKRGMDQDGMLHSAIYYFEAGAEEPLPPARDDALYSFGTHDLPRFADFLEGGDLRDAAGQGELDPAALELALQARARWVAALCDELALDLGTAPEELYVSLMQRIVLEHPRGLLLDLGDLLGDPARENRPGLLDPGNWTHRLPVTLAELVADDALRNRLCRVARHVEVGAEPDLRR